MGMYGAGPFPGGPFPYGPAPHVGDAASGRPQHEHVRSSSPPVPECDVHDFCVKYNLGEAAEDGLQKLGFQIGDDLNSVPQSEWDAAGFKLLAWKRVLKAYAKHKRTSRNV